MKESQILARPPWQHFGHVFSTFSSNSVWKWSPLVLGEISGLLVNILTTYDKYPVQDSENFQLPIQMQLSEKRKTFSEFVVPSLESTSNFKHFERILVIANVFVSLQTVKNLVRTLSKQRCFRTRFNSQHVKVSQILAISPWRRFYHVFSSFSLKLTRKMLPLAFGEILWASVNTVTTDGKCFVQHCENLLFPIQMQLSEK